MIYLLTNYLFIKLKNGRNKKRDDRENTKRERDKPMKRDKQRKGERVDVKKPCCYRQEDYMYKKGIIIFKGKKKNHELQYISKQLSPI